MAERVFVKVVGFADVERHALNTVFRLSEQRDTAYVLWGPESPGPARMALLDGQSWEARVEAESPSNQALPLIWVGEGAPDGMWRTFDRPIAWTDVLQAMDLHFAPHLALDLALDPPGPEPVAPGRSLVASADPLQRLYLRAKLSLARLTQVDEAASATEAMSMARQQKYHVAVVDFDLRDLEGWAGVKALADGGVRHLVLTKEKTSVGGRLRARMAGAEGFFGKPPDPGRLQDLLERFSAELPGRG